MSDREELAMAAVQRLQEIDTSMQQLIQAVSVSGNTQFLEGYIRGYINEIDENEVMQAYIDYEIGMGSIHSAMLRVGLIRDLCTVLDEKEQTDLILIESKKAYSLITQYCARIEQVNTENPGTVKDKDTRVLTDLLNMFLLRLTDAYCRRGDYLLAVPYSKQLWIAQAIAAKNEEQIQKLLSWTDKEWIDSLVKANDERNKKMPQKKKQQAQLQYPSYKTITKLTTCGEPSCGKKEQTSGAFKQCSRCKKAFYCSVDCQKKHVRYNTTY